LKLPLLLLTFLILTMLATWQTSPVF